MSVRAIRAVFFGIVVVVSAALTLGRACASRSPASPTATTSALPDTMRHRLALPGEGSWDHVVASSVDRRLYVAHASHLDVLDLDGDSLVAVLDSLPGVHGVALDPVAHRGYTSDGGDSSITVFDMRSLRVLKRLHLQADAPDGIVFDLVSRRVFAMHGDAPSLSVVDAGPDSVRGTMALGGSPDGGVPDGHGRLYVALKDRGELLVIDTQHLVVEQRWPLAPCQGPDAIAIDTSHARVFLGCDNGMVVSIETATGVVHPGFAIGPRVDGVSLLGSEVVASTADGVVTIADCEDGRCTTTRTLATNRGSRTSALDGRTRRLFVPFDTRFEDRSPAPGPHAARSLDGEGFGVLVLPLP